MDKKKCPKKCPEWKVLLKLCKKTRPLHVCRKNPKNRKNTSYQNVQINKKQNYENRYFLVLFG